MKSYSLLVFEERGTNEVIIFPFEAFEQSSSTADRVAGVDLDTD